MNQGAIKLIISTDARQAEKELKRLEEQKKKIVDVEKENAELSKSHAQAAASAQKAAKAVDAAYSKLSAAKAKQEEYAAGVRERFSFGAGLSGGFASSDEAADMALASDKKYQKMVSEVSQLTAELERLKEAQSTAEVSQADLGEQIAETTRRLSEERAKLTEYQDAYKQTASALGSASSKLKGVSKSSKRAASGLLSVKKQSVPLAKSILKLSSMFKLMLIRMAMRKVIEPVRKGFEQLAQYSDAFNGTMSSLSTSSLYLSNALATVFKPVLEALSPVIETITENMVGVANAVSAFTASLFGNATTYTKAKKAAVDYAKAITGVSKKNKNVLASFDEINKLNSGDEDGMPDPEDMFQEEEIDETVTSMTDKVKEMLNGWREAAQPTIEAFNNLTGSLEPLKSFAATGLKTFYTTLLVPLGNWALGEGLPRFLDITRKLAGDIDWDRLSGAVQDLCAAVEPLAEKVGEGLLWFYENVISPLIKWAANVLIPHALDLITAALNALAPVIDALKPVADWLWQEFLKPLGEWTGQIIINAIQWLTDKLNEFAAWARENPETIQRIADIILAFLGGVIAYYTVKKICTVVEAIGTAFKTFGAVLMSPAGQVAMLAFGLGLLAVGIKKLAAQWDTLTTGEQILTVFASALLAAAAAWAAFHISATAGFAAATIVGGLALIGLTGLFSSGKSKSPSSSTRTPRTMELASMPKLSAVPHFATGAVVPPNNEFLAVMGDNKKEREFVTPESGMKQAFLEALAESGTIGGERDITIIMEVDRQQFGRAVYRANREATQRVGVSLVKGV